MDKVALCVARAQAYARDEYGVHTLTPEALKAIRVSATRCVICMHSDDEQMKRIDAIARHAAYEAHLRHTYALQANKIRSEFCVHDTLPFGMIREPPAKRREVNALQYKLPSNTFWDEWMQAQR